MSSIKLARTTWPAFLTSAFIAAALVVLAGSPRPARAASSASVRLTDFKVSATPTVTAGSTTFVVRNNGMMDHEFVVIRTTRRANALPVRGSEASEAGRVGEIRRVPMGATKRLTLHLSRGHYALICNEPGHYKLGMHADMTVR